MNTILVVIPCHTADIGSAQQTIEWIRGLNGTAKRGHCLLVVDAATPKPNIESLKASAKDTFESWDAIGIAAGIKKGVDASNFMFLHTAKTIQERYRTPWLWLEPDCIPIRPTWLDELEAEYARSPKLYMGAFVHSTDPMLPKTHVAGCAVYPNKAFDQLKNFCGKERAWDIEAAASMVPAAQETSLIQHFWGPAKDIFPVFVDTRYPDSPENHVTVDFVKRESALFHRSKDGSLIRLLKNAMVAERARQRGLASARPPTASEGKKTYQQMNAMERRAYREAMAAEKQPAEPVPA